MNDMIDYFEGLSIDIDELYDFVGPALPDYIFDGQGILAEVELTIPDDTSYDKSYFEFTRSKHVKNIYTCDLGRIITLEDDTYYSEITGVETTDVSEEDTQKTVAFHGRGMLFENGEEEDIHILRYNYIVKDHTTFRPSFYFDFLSCYYYLYTDNTNAYYHYMRQLSMDKKNSRNENKEVMVPRRKHYGQIKAWW